MVFPWKIRVVISHGKSRWFENAAIGPCLRFERETSSFYRETGLGPVEMKGGDYIIPTMLSMAETFDGRLAVWHLGS